MFDLRYHVASLAAVFLMLVVGILIGVGISGRGFVTTPSGQAERQNQRARRSNSTPSNANVDDLERRQQAAAGLRRECVSGTRREPPCWEERRSDRAWLRRPESLDFVQSAINDERAGASRGCARSRCRFDSTRSSRLWSRSQEFSGYVGDEQLGNLGRDLGRELVSGGKTPLWDALEAEIVEQRTAISAEPVDGVVVIRSAEPQAGPDVALPRRARTRASAAQPTRRRRRAHAGSSRARSPSSSAFGSRRWTGSTRSSASSRSSSCSAAPIPATTASATPPKTESCRRSSRFPPRRG